MTTAKPTGSYIGPYQVLRELGAGGMGRVYLARSPGGRDVAVKLLRDELAGSTAYRQRFAAEAEAARRVAGVFTAPVIDADPFGPEPWLATAFVPGPTLEQAVRDSGPLAEAALRELAAGLAEALAAIHAAGLAHRDLKPSNVLMSTDGPQVIDFGISSGLDLPGEQQSGEASSFGTPGYSAPEQASGERPADARADVFALGAVLVYAARGHSPFGQGPPAALRYRAAFEEPDLRDLPGSTRATIAACLDKDPGRRPSPAQVLAALAPLGWAATLSTAATDFRTSLLPPPGTTVALAEPAAQAPRSGMSRRRLLYLSGAIAGGATVVAGVTALVLDLAGGKGSGGGSVTPTGSPTATPLSLGTFAENSASLPKAPKPLWTVTPPSTTGMDAIYRLSTIDDVVLWYPAVIPADYYSSATQGPLIAYHAATGKQAWSAAGKIPTRGQGQRVLWVGVADSLIYGYLTATGSDYSQIVSVLAMNSSGKLVLHRDLSDSAGDINAFCYVSQDVALVTEVTLQLGSSAEQLTAYSLKNGRRLWATTVGLSAPPGIVADSSRCFVFRDGTVTAYDLHRGTKLWQQNPGLGANCVLSPGAKALLVSTQQTMSIGGGAGAGIVAYDPATGKRLWSTASGVVLTTIGTTAYTTGTAASVFSALDQATGQVRWAFKSPALAMNATAGNNPQANGLASATAVTVPLMDFSGSYTDSQLSEGPGILVLDSKTGRAHWAYAGAADGGDSLGQSATDFTGTYTLTISDSAVFATAGSKLVAFPTGS